MIKFIPDPVQSYEHTPVQSYEQGAEPKYLISNKEIFALSNDLRSQPDSSRQDVRKTPQIERTACLMMAGCDP